jgi:acyl-CoA synthetase (AMP-forming)/AMP-acid ligase II
VYTAEWAEATPDRVAVTFDPTGETLTYAEFDAAANRAAQLFRALGLQQGDHIAVFMENDPALLVLAAGASRSGIYFTLVNSHLNADEAAYIVDDCRARIAVSSQELSEVARELPERCPRVEHWFMVHADPLPAPYEELEPALAAQPSAPIADQSVGVPMLYSSGTTGRPKGILRGLPDPSEGLTGPAARRSFLADMWRMREGQMYLSPAPLYHSAPLASVTQTLLLGGTSVVMRRFDPARYLELVEQHRITHSQVVPTMFTRLLRLPEEVRKGADVSSLEWVVHAAAPCPVPIKEQMIDWFGPIILEYYGATEAFGFTACDSFEWLAHKGTVGRPVVGELHILDDDGNDCPPGTIGTVWFSGATNFQYFNDPEKTAASRDASGTSSTVGDIGYVDDDGFLFLTDRATFMIISGGVNIYPQEVENALAVHPSVLDVAVIGVPDPDFGEAVKAVVQLAPGVEPGPETEAVLLDYCREHVAHYKCPRSVDFVDELPRLPTGKLYKQKVREPYWRDAGA